jgi:predicted DNA-binding ribbon-helix-helix protein
MSQASLRPAKHSLTLHGHRTSVSLEPAFWEAFQAMAQDRGLTLNALAAEIDATRADQGLATAIRLAVLHHLQSRSAQGPSRTAGPNPAVGQIP